MINGNIRKKLIAYSPYMIIALFLMKLGQSYRLSPGNGFGEKILHISEGMSTAFVAFPSGIHIFDVCVGIICACLIRLAVYAKSKNRKKFRRNTEFGSAVWGCRKDIEPFMDKIFQNNIVLTKTEFLTMNSRPSVPKNARNKNVLVIGSSGSGKTRFFVMPNLMQCRSKSYPVSYILTDPKFLLPEATGYLFLRAGYKLKAFNTIDFKKSMHYNPFAYIHTEKDILKFVHALIGSTKGNGRQGDDFWEKSELLLYTALVALIKERAPEREQNFSTMLSLLDSMQVSEDDENFKNAVDLLFEDYAKDHKNSLAVRQYAKFKLSAGKTSKSILISCGARLAPFDIDEVREITMYDELNLDKLGDERTILYLGMSDTDGSLNFLISLIYSQLFNILCEKADSYPGGRLPVHVRCIIDECANIPQIKDLEKIMATIRSREISACLILQTQSQLKAIYKDNAETIIGNCDSRLFLGGTEPTTIKDLSESLGTETIDTYNTGESRGREKSSSLNYQKLGKKLMTPDEIEVMDGEKCILRLRGVRPFLSDKYDITKHPNYKYLAEYDKRFSFDIESYIGTKLDTNTEDEVIVYQCQ